MDHLQQIAKAYYLAGSSELQAGLQDLFYIVDTNVDGRIDKHEFISLLTQHSVDKERDTDNCRILFNELDIDGNGTLDFWEFMTLLYIYESKRPSCDGCGKFIPATYFTCVDCHADLHTQFNLCIGCYENRRSSGHKHRGKPAVFLDNYTLLDVKRSSSLNTNTDDVNNISQASTSTPASPPNNNTSTAVVRPSTKYDKWSVALQAVQEIDFRALPSVKMISRPGISSSILSR
nr:Ca2+ sensor (EF-Hand superfamily) [Ipomoea batatas]